MVSDPIVSCHVCTEASARQQNVAPLHQPGLFLKLMNVNECGDESLTWQLSPHCRTVLS
jgi:hypothetical protein